MRALSIVLGAGALLAACAGAPQTSCTAGLHAAVLDQLYFGTARAHAPPLDAQDWEQFVSQDLAPRLPQGYTLLEAQGQWRGADGGVAREQTHLLQWAHADDAASDALLRQIVERYKARFDQEAVLQVRSPTCMAP